MAQRRNFPFFSFYQAAAALERKHSTELDIVVDKRSLAVQEAEVKENIIPSEIIDDNDREAAMHAIQDPHKRQLLFDFYEKSILPHYQITTVDQAKSVIKDFQQLLINKIQDRSTSPEAKTRYQVALRRVRGLDEATMTGFKTSLYNVDGYLSNFMDLSAKPSFHPLVIFANQYRAAFDSEMKLTPEHLAEIDKKVATVTDNPEAADKLRVKLRADYVAASGTAFIGGFVDDMCRENNEPNDPLTTLDSTCCAPGFIGKMFLNLNRYNSLATVPSPSLSFGPLKEDIKNFIVQELSQLRDWPTEAKPALKKCIYDYFINRSVMLTKPSEMEGEDALAFIQYQEILAKIQSKPEALIDYLKQKMPHKSKAIDEQAAAVIKQFNIECEHIKFEREDAKPDPISIHRIFQDYFNSVPLDQVKGDLNKVLAPAASVYSFRIRNEAKTLELLALLLRNELERGHLVPGYFDDPAVSMKRDNLITQMRIVERNISHLDKELTDNYTTLAASIQERVGEVDREAKSLGVLVENPLDVIKKQISKQTAKQLEEIQKTLTELNAMLTRLNVSLATPAAERPKANTAEWADDFVRVAIAKNNQGHYLSNTHELNRLMEFMTKVYQNEPWNIQDVIAEINGKISKLPKTDSQYATQLLGPLFPRSKEEKGADSFSINPHSSNQLPIALCFARINQILGHGFMATEAEKYSQGFSLILGAKNPDNSSKTDRDIELNLNAWCTNAKALMKNPAEMTKEDANKISHYVLLTFLNNLQLSHISESNHRQLEMICEYYLGTRVLPKYVQLGFLPLQASADPSTKFAERIQSLGLFLTCMMKTLEPIKVQFNDGLVHIASREEGHLFLKSLASKSRDHTGHEGFSGICRISTSQPDCLVIQRYGSQQGITNNFVDHFKYSKDSVPLFTQEKHTLFGYPLAFNVDQAHIEAAVTEKIVPLNPDKQGMTWKRSQASLQAMNASHVEATSFYASVTAESPEELPNLYAVIARARSPRDPLGPSPSPTPGPGPASTDASQESKTPAPRIPGKF